MIIKEKIIEPTSTNELYKFYSNKDFFLRKGDILYAEIIESQDTDTSNYTETTIPIPEKIINHDEFYFNMAGERQITKSVFNRGMTTLKEIIKNISSQEAYYIGFLCPYWKNDVIYESGDKVYYNNKLYEALNTTHNVTPDISSDFSEIQPPQDVIEYWDESYNKNYRKGDKVKIGTHIYESLIEDNCWSPLQFSAAWKIIE